MTVEIVSDSWRKRNFEFRNSFRADLTHKMSHIGLSN